MMEESKAGERVAIVMNPGMEATGRSEIMNVPEVDEVDYSGESTWWAGWGHNPPPNPAQHDILALCSMMASRFFLFFFSIFPFFAHPHEPNLLLAHREAQNWSRHW